jgi:predicted ATPase
VEKIRRGLDELPVSLKVQLRDEKRHINVEADDIGVGVSQVVPVVVGAMDPAHKVFFVEQPELHIHPRVQCSLADLFIEQINASSEKMFVLETHSEHLILRLLRRIRETYEQNSADSLLNSDTPVLPETRHLTSDQIGIIYIDSDENGMNVTNIGVTPEGDFETRWPSGFFDERLKEVF